LFDARARHVCERVSVPTKRGPASTKAGKDRGADRSSRQRRDEMRSNSGLGEGTNNNRNPTLRDHERAKGVSGEALLHEKKHGAKADRTSARKRGADA
jgi:hypothetical protein